MQKTLTNIEILDQVARRFCERRKLANESKKQQKSKTKQRINHRRFHVRRRPTKRYALVSTIVMKTIPTNHHSVALFNHLRTYYFEVDVDALRAQIDGLVRCTIAIRQSY
jgi:hypothetical protein